jgi:hypothetical protein
MSIIRRGQLSGKGHAKASYASQDAAVATDFIGIRVCSAHSAIHRILSGRQLKASLRCIPGLA